MHTAPSVCIIVSRACPLFFIGSEKRAALPSLPRETPKSSHARRRLKNDDVSPGVSRDRCSTTKPFERAHTWACTNYVICVHNAFVPFRFGRWPSEKRELASDTFDAVLRAGLLRTRCFAKTGLRRVRDACPPGKLFK